MTDPFNPEFKRALDAMETGTFRVFNYDLEGTYTVAAPPPRPRRRHIRLALRGYDVRQVEDLLKQAEAALDHGTEIQRVVARQALRSADLNTRMPGYSMGGVHNLFDRLTRQLGGGRLALPAGSSNARETVAPPARDTQRSGRHRGRR